MSLREELAARLVGILNSTVVHTETTPDASLRRSRHETDRPRGQKRVPDDLGAMGAHHRDGTADPRPRRLEAMNRPPPIVSLSGDDALHARAESYNRRLGLLRDAEEDRDNAYAWNHRERFGTGFFAQTKPPVPVVGSHVETLRSELIRERAEIAALANGSLKP